MDTSIYSHAIDLWSKADLPDLQKNLDENIISIKSKETESIDSRKLLAKETKSFKKKSEEEKLTSINKIIKQYQNEIDSLTKRSKFSESILFDIYSKVSEVPDPLPLLKNSINSLKVDNSKDQELQNEINVLLKDKESLNNQLNEIKEKQNEESTKLKNEIETLNKKLEILNKLQSDKAKDNQDSPQISLLTEELNNSISKISDLENKNNLLTKDLTKLKEDLEHNNIINANEKTIKNLTNENIKLTKDLNSNQLQLTSLKDSSKREIDELKLNSTTYKSELDSIRRKLNQFQDYNKIKDELSALKSIEFGTVENDDDDDDTNEGTNSANKNSSSKDSKVDSTLLATNKQLQKKLAELRGSTVDLEEKNKNLNNQVNVLNEKISSLEKLNQKLELDIDKIEDIDQKFNDTASMMSGVTRQLNSRPLGNSKRNNGGKLSPTSSIVGIPEEGEFNMNNANLLSNNNILPIITKQRDRFRAKNMELEKQLRLNKIELEKLKDQQSSIPSSSTNNDIESNILRNNSSSGLADPINIYRKGKSSNDYYRNKDLSIIDKFFNRFLLKNDINKKLFIIYCIALHFIIIILFVGFNKISKAHASSILSNVNTNNLKISDNSPALGAGNHVLHQGNL